MPKSGSAFDLPIAVSILASTGQMHRVERLERFAPGGELRARESGLAGIVVPEPNVAGAAVVEGLEVRGAATLEQVVRFMAGSADVGTAHVSGAIQYRSLDRVLAT